MPRQSPHIQHMDIKQFNDTQWSRNVILVDGDYVDSVAFNLIINFERMLGRRIPKADMARWIDCIALDGGMRTERDADGETQVIFIPLKTRQHSTTSHQATTMPTSMRRHSKTSWASLS